MDWIMIPLNVLIVFGTIYKVFELFARKEERNPDIPCCIYCVYRLPGGLLLDGNQTAHRVMPAGQPRLGNTRFCKKK